MRVYHSYADRSARELAQKGNKKMITAQDVMNALPEIGFEELCAHVEAMIHGTYHSIYR
jgi:hypothetical protein